MDKEKKKQIMLDTQKQILDLKKALNIEAKFSDADIEFMQSLSRESYEFFVRKYVEHDTLGKMPELAKIAAAIMAKSVMAWADTLKKD